MVLARATASPDRSTGHFFRHGVFIRPPGAVNFQILNPPLSANAEIKHEKGVTAHANGATLCHLAPHP